MSKRTVIDVVSGRHFDIAEPVSDMAAFAERLDRSKREQGTITLRAERMAVASDFTRQDFRNAKPRTRVIWQRRAMLALIKEGHTFSRSIVAAYN